MQFKFISIGFTVAFLMTVVSAGSFDRTGNGGIRVITEDPAPEQEPKVERVGDTYIVHPDTKRSLPDSKRIATATRRRRALTRRGEEADEEEEDEDENENEDEEQDSAEADSTEEESVADTVVNNEDIKETESENSEWERRSSVAGGLPIVGDILGGSQSTGEGSGGILGGL